MSDRNIRTWEPEEFERHIGQPWQNYLDRLENSLLKRSLLPSSWLVDLGAGNGRFLNAYNYLAQNKVLVDYSLPMLMDAKRRAQALDAQNTYFVAADVNNLPFKASSFDFALMIRLIHHINNPEVVLKEVNRIISIDGLFFLEYQNKRNINFIIKSLIGKMPIRNILSMDPMGIKPLFWNYHPRYLETMVARYFIIEGIFGGGLFWNRKFLTKYFSNLEKIDMLVTSILGKLHLTHQIFLRLRVKKSIENMIYEKFIPQKNLVDILICNKCRIGSLEYLNSCLTCLNCGHNFNILEGIFDFR